MGNMRLYYLLDGRVSVFINREVSWSNLERMDYLAFETVFQLYIRMKAANISKMVIRSQIIKLWSEMEQDRDAFVQALVDSGSLSPTKAKRSVENEDSSVASMTDLDFDSSLLSKPKKEQFTLAHRRSVTVNSLDEVVTVGQHDSEFQVSGLSDKDGYYKVASDFKISVLGKFRTHSLVDKIAPMENHNGWRLKITPHEFKSPYKMEEDELQSLIFKDEALKQELSNCSNTFVLELAANIDARLQIAKAWLSSSTSIAQLVFKRFLGLNVRHLGQEEVFGERALESRVARTASIVSESRCVYFLII